MSKKNLKKLQQIQKENEFWNSKRKLKWVKPHTRDYSNKVQINKDFSWSRGLSLSSKCDYNILSTIATSNTAKQHSKCPKNASQFNHLGLDCNLKVLDPLTTDPSPSTSQINITTPKMTLLTPKTPKLLPHQTLIKGCHFLTPYSNPYYKISLCGVAYRLSNKQKL